MVVDITLLHLEEEVQLFGRIQCVTYPGYIAEVVFLSFLNLHEDVYRAVIVGLDTVCHDDGVTITQFVVFVDNQLFVRFVVVLNEFLGAEQIEQLALFVCFLHHTLQLLGREGLVAYNGDLMYFHFLLLVDVDVDNHFILLFRIITLGDDYICILEALVVKVALYQGLGAVHQVRCNLTALYHADSAFQVFTLRLLHTVVAYVGNTRTHGQMNGQPNLVAFNLVCCNFHVREQTVAPVALTSLCNLVTRHGDSLPFG